MAPAEIVHIGGAHVGRDGDLWNLTDLWRAAGSIEGKRPAEWLRYDGKPFVDFVRDNLSVGLTHTDPQPQIVRTVVGGKAPGTWAHWQLAMSYAKWISLEFHAKVNAVYKAYADGQLVERQQIVTAVPDIVLRLEAFKTARRGTFSDELKREFLRLRKIEWDWTGSEPIGLSFPYGRTWRIILGNTVYKALKARNPHPRKGSSHSQWLRDEAYKLARESDLVVACAIARRAATWSQYEHELRGVFQKAPLQLGLVRNDRRPMLGTGT